MSVHVCLCYSYSGLPAEHMRLTGSISPLRTCDYSVSGCPSAAGNTAVVSHAPCQTYTQHYALLFLYHNSCHL